MDYDLNQLQIHSAYSIGQTEWINIARLNDMYPVRRLHRKPIDTPATYHASWECDAI